MRIRTREREPGAGRESTENLVFRLKMELKSMAEIRVTPEGGDEYRVVVQEGGKSTEHRVTATPSHVEQFGAGVDPETLIEESFRFLLEREPKESILGRFELSVIARYFPEYPEEIRRRLDG